MHLSMRKSHICFRHQCLDLRRHLIDILHFIVHIVNLSLPRKFSRDCLADKFLIVLHNISLDRHTIHRRLFQHTHITDADQTHMKSSRDWCCRQREDIHVRLELLDLLLVRHTKALLLIHDQKSQILELHILRQDAVRSHNDIHLSLAQILDRFLLLRRCTETA